MKSTSGKYYIGLDHVRGFAAFLVFSWHFIHARDGHLAGPPVPPLSLFAEGHTGVALFMSLSGYLFAKLLEDKEILYRPFLYNRVLRLAPLLGVALVGVGVDRWLSGEALGPFFRDIATGLVKPTLPQGGWSITVELHFYVVLPLLLALARRDRRALFGALGAALALRVVLHAVLGQIQELAYWTIVGRIDQFILGILAYQYRDWFREAHRRVVPILVAFLGFYTLFDWQGGFYTGPSYPSPRAIWLVLPTLEGAAYATLIAWYDTSFSPGEGRISRFFAAIGTYSYSIYLLHFFVVFRMSKWLAAHVDMTQLEVAIGLSVPGFLLVLPIGYLGYHLIERPFLRFRTKYTRPRAERRA